jgi:hypothetical protein
MGSAERGLPRRTFLLGAAAVAGATALPDRAFAAPSAGAHPVTLKIGGGHPGPMVPADFAGLSFEVGPLVSGNAGVSGYFFNPANTTLVTLFRNLGLRNIRIGGGTVDQQIPAGSGTDGYTGVDNFFGFVAATGTKAIYTLRLFDPSTDPIPDLMSEVADIAGYIWRHYQRYVSNIALSNEPDWHSFHTSPGHPEDPTIYETVPDEPGSAYPSYLAEWRRYAAAVAKAMPPVRFSGPDTGNYGTRGALPYVTNTPTAANGVSWTEQFAKDTSHQVAEITQHFYAGGSPLTTTAQQAIDNMLSPEWVIGTEIATQPAGQSDATAYVPYPWLYEHNIAPVVALQKPYRLTESNDYLTGVPGASDGYAAALWTLDYMHWWAQHGAAGVNFHNKQWIYTDTIIQDPRSPATRFSISPKGYGIRAFTVGSTGRVEPIDIENADGVNLTAYCIGGGREHYVTLINKSQGGGAADAAVTIEAGHRIDGAQVLVLAGTAPGDATGTTATLGGAMITGDAPWRGRWDRLSPAGSRIRLTVPATTAAVVRILDEP